MLSKKDQILKLVQKMGVIRPKDLLKRDIAKIHLKRLLDEGKIERLQKGLYALPGKDFGEHHRLIETCKRAPGGVVCLLSALSFHKLTTQSPHEIWMAFPNKAWTPKMKDVSLKVVRYSETTFKSGVETHSIHGVPVKLFNIPKTVADCFKYRNKIGIDVAIEALQECWRSRKCTMDELWKYAKICRVSRIMKPYMEMLT